MVKGGVLEPMGIAAAKEAILQAQGLFTNWRFTGVEDVGVGKVFQQYLRTDTRVRFVPSNIADPKTGRIRDKKARFEYQVAPWLDNGIILISIGFLLDFCWVSFN